MFWNKPIFSFPSKGPLHIPSQKPTISQNISTIYPTQPNSIRLLYLLQFTFIHHLFPDFSSFSPDFHQKKHIDFPRIFRGFPGFPLVPVALRRFSHVANSWRCGDRRRCRPRPSARPRDARGRTWRRRGGTRTPPGVGSACQLNISEYHWISIFISFYIN